MGKHSNIETNDSIKKGMCDHSVSTHSKVMGGSSCKRDIKCPGNRILRKKAPPGLSSDAAQLGTMLHCAVEGVLDQNLNDLDELIGSEVELDEKDNNGDPVIITITKDHVDHKIEPAVYFFDELDPTDFWLEETVVFDGKLEGAFGIADLLYHTDTRAGLVDWKFGDNVGVSAEDNYQLKFYLAAAIRNEEFSKGFTEFDAYIVQPIEGVKEYWSKDTYTLEELRLFEEELTAAWLRIQQGDDSLQSGDWCQFCPAKPICSEWRNRGKKALEKVPRETLKGRKKADYDHETLKEAYLEAVELGKWATAVKDRVKLEFANKNPVTGLKRVVARENRAWIDEKVTVNWLRRQGFKVADYNEPAELRSVAGIEKLVGKDKLAKKLVKKVVGGYSIVSEDDAKPDADKKVEDTAKLLSDSLK